MLEIVKSELFLRSMKEATQLEEQAEEIRKTTVLTEVRRNIIQVDSYIIDLKENRLGRVCERTRGSGDYVVKFLDNDEKRSYKVADFNTRLATEDELLDFFMPVVNTKTSHGMELLLKQKFVHFPVINRVAKIIGIREDGKLLVEYLYKKFKEGYPIAEDTDMSGFILRKDALSNPQLARWSVASKEETHLFCRKLAEATGIPEGAKEVTVGSSEYPLT